MEIVKELVLDIKLKKCKTCSQLLPLTDYHKDPKSKDRLFYSCRKCYAVYRKNIRKNNPRSEEEKEEYNRKNKIYYEKTKEKKAASVKRRRKDDPRPFRDRAYQWKYGISITEYDEMLERQNNACAICKLHQSDLNYSMVVDHSHTINKIRGLLCRNCNAAIGLFKDNIEVIQNSILYLEKFKEHDNS